MTSIRIHAPLLQSEMHDTFRWALRLATDRVLPRPKTPLDAARSRLLWTLEERIDRQMYEAPFGENDEPTLQELF